MSKGTGVPTPSILATPDFTQGVVLASSVGQAFDVPTGMGFVGFSFTGDFWVKYGSTAALIPSTSTTAGSSTPELNPTYRNFGSTQGCTGISIIAAAACSGSINWFKPS